MLMLEKAMLKKHSKFLPMKNYKLKDGNMAFVKRYDLIIEKMIFYF